MLHLMAWGRRATADVVVGRGRVVEVRQQDGGRSFVAGLGVIATIVLMFTLIAASQGYGW